MALVLVVDDEPDICDLVRLGLSRSGHDVVVAHDGREALAAAAQHRPDVIVLDLVLPGLHGWDVLAALKTCPNEEIAHIPVVLLTTQAGEIDRIKGAIEGAVGHLGKPFSMDDLRAAVADALCGEPEPAKRRRAQERAMRLLTEMEAAALFDSFPPRTDARAARQGAPVQVEAGALATLSPRQRVVLAAVVRCPTVTDAAAALGMSRTAVYANLRRAARHLGLGSARELLQAARARHTGTPDAATTARDDPGSSAS